MDNPAKKDIPEEIVEPLCSAIGHLILSWGMIDSNVTALVSIIYKQFGGNKIEPEIPRNWGRRIKFLKKCISRTDALHQIAPHILSKLDYAEKIEHLRTFVVHGTVKEYIPEDEHMLVFRKLDTSHDKQSHRDDTLAITTKAFLSYVTTANLLVGDLIKLNSSLIEPFVPKEH